MLTAGVAANIWQDLSGWQVVSAIVLTLVGVGVGVMSMSPPEYQVAKVCFAIAGPMLVVKVGMWLVTLASPPQQRMIVAFLLFGLIGLAWVEAYRWVESRQVRASDKTEQNHFATTLKTNGRTWIRRRSRQPFKSDFPNVLKITDEERIGIEWKNQDVLRIKTQVYADFPAKTQFVGFYIPASPRTPEACLRLVDATE